MTRLIALLILLAAIPLYGQSFTLTRGDFSQTAGQIHSLDAGILTFQPAGPIKSTDEPTGESIKQPITLPLADLLSLHQTNSKPADNPPNTLHLHLSNRDRIAGRPVSLDGDTLLWQNPLLGDLPVNLRAIRAITRSNQPPNALSTPLTADRARLANNDTLDGFLTNLTADSFTLTTAANSPVTAPLASLQTLRLASPGESPAQQPFRIDLTDGTTLSANALNVADNVATLGLLGREIRVPLAQILTIHHPAGPVAFLSDMTPLSDTQTPFLGQPVPTRFNFPLAFNNQFFEKTIAVHSRSILTFNIPPGYHTFRTQYALPPGLPLANITLRIKLDGRLIHQQTNFVTNTLSPVLQFPVENAKTLTLEADYGQTYDVQDDLLWINAALVK